VFSEKTYVNGEMTFEKVNFENGEYTEGYFGDNFTTYKGYYENGQLSSEEYYVDGERDGRWVEYDDEENITDEDIYKDGKCIEMCEGNE
jgi:antitoxin component YwqK of YwqJK toxin-antitoxin module